MMPEMYESMRRSMAYDRLFDAIQCVDYTEFCINPSDLNDVSRTNDSDVTRRDFGTNDAEGVGEPIGKMVRLDASDMDAFRRDFKQLLDENNGKAIKIAYKGETSTDRYVHIRKGVDFVDVGVSDFDRMPELEFELIMDMVEEPKWEDKIRKQAQDIDSSTIWKSLQQGFDDLENDLDDEDEDEDIYDPMWPITPYFEPTRKKDDGPEFC